LRSEFEREVGRLCRVTDFSRSKRCAFSGVAGCHEKEFLLGRQRCLDFEIVILAPSEVHCEPVFGAA
jgi:hypothetical protein